MCIRAYVRSVFVHRCVCADILGAYLFCVGISGSEHSVLYDDGETELVKFGSGREAFRILDQDAVASSPRPSKKPRFVVTRAADVHGLRSCVHDGRSASCELNGDVHFGV